MVFESIVVDVLNKFLGDYVENLNRSQLKLGIWGGDVVLENLVLKQNALEELNIPVQTVYGHLGKLTLKIPWQNLYGASVEARVERLFLVVNPNAEVKYDPEKEEKIALASKQAELARVEEAKKKEVEEDKMDETFVEKLVTQIIKNVQLTIKDIHVRYEDSITNPKQPFSLGMTLHNLSVHTTDENWKQTVIQEAVTKIYKILSLEGLAIYWNPETELYAKTSTESIKSRLQQEIATKTSQPSFYSYALGPINATAKLKLNPKPEADTNKFSTPKVTLSLHMEQLSISLSKGQYRDMMLMFDSMDRMSKGEPYRKYRPDLKTYRGHYKEWWKFAYTCILEEEVRRRRNNWDWAHMLQHRQLCKNYATVYQGKLTTKGKISNDQQKVLEEAEKKLDLLNLVVIRQRIEMEVERLGKLEAEARKSRGWFSGWWSGANAKDDQLSENTDILKQFQNAMTSDEKDKLFRAIDYQENSAPQHLPVEYVAVSGEFRLDRLQLTLTDDTPVLAAAVDGVSIDFYQRPSANAIRTDIHMHTFTVSGTQQGQFIPSMVVSKEVAHDVHLLNIMFETNPIDKSCDQRVKVTARPLQIVYDAQTVIRIVEVFKPPQESTALTTLQAAAENKLSDLKEKSALGMQYAVHQHTFIDLDVDVAPSYIIIPQTGQYREDVQCAVIKLGAIRLKSEPRAAGGPLDVAKLYRSGLDDEHVLQEIAKHSYDKITLALTQMQIVVAKKGEDWHAAIAAEDEGTPLHLLQPTNLIIQIHKCLITDDPRMPKVKVRGELEKIAISISQDRLLSLCEILVSMPLPQSEVSTQLKSSESKASSLSLLTKYLDPAEKQKRETARMKKEQATGEPSVQLTEVEAFFIIKEVTVCVNRTKLGIGALYEKFLVFGLTSLELTVTQKTYNLEAMVRLGAVSMSHHRVGHQTVFIIDTPEGVQQVQTALEIMSHKDSEYLITITYCNVDKKCPEFRSLYGSVEQLIELKFTKLKMHLHLQSLQEIMMVVNEYQTRLADIQSTQDRVADAGPLETIMEEEELAATKSKTSVTKPGSKKTVESIQIKMKAKLGTVEIEFATDLRPLSLVRLQGMRTGVIVKASYTEVDFNIASLYVRDLNANTLHKDILKVVGGDVVNVRVVMFNTESFPTSDVDMSIDAQLNTLRIIFLNWFVTSMLDFLNNFQTAQQAIVDASAQAAEAARERAAQAYQNSTKVLLKVRMAAPIIIVPENSRSAKCLIVDLGRMNINNRFLNLNVDNSIKTVTVDELTLEMEEMKVSCAIIGGDRGLQAERELLRPTTFKLLVKRSLSTWHQALPDLDVSGRIHNITITVGHSDYKSIMRILNQNLTEGQEVAPKPAVSKTVSKTTVKTQASRVVTKSALAVVEPSAEKKDDKALKATMKFCFTMDKLMINLSSNDETIDIHHDIELARLTLSLLSLKGRMFSDGSMHTTLLLVDCTVDDTRPNRGSKIIRYLGRRTKRDEAAESAPPDKIRSMVDITYTLKNNDTFIDMRIFSFNLILAMDFLNKLAEFATSGLTADPVERQAHVIAPVIDLPSIEEAGNEEQKSTEDKALPTRKRLSVVSQPLLSDKDIEPVQQSMMTVNIKIEQPDIILVESLEDRSCDAFVLNMEGRFKLRQTSERMVADGGISSLQVTARRLDELLGPDSLDAADAPTDGSLDLATLPNVEFVPHTSATSGPPRDRASPEKSHPRYLLAPTHMSLAVSQPPGSGMHVDIAITDIKITISPDMLALLMRVLATMQSSEDDNNIKVETTLFYDSVWDIRPIKPNAYWFLKTEEAKEALEYETEALTPTQPPVGEICLLSSPSIVISFEMQIGRETVPVLVMQASLQGHLKDWSSDLHMESTWAMQVSYYNIARAEWEPLVEPVERMVDCVYKHEPWELKIEMTMRPGENRAIIDTSDEAMTNKAVAAQQANKTITVSSAEPLEITITRTGMEVLTLLSNSLAPATDAITAIKSKSEDDFAKKSYGAPYVLHNSTGLTAKLLLAENNDFTVCLTERQSNMDYKEVILEAGARVPLRLKHAGLAQLKLNEPPPPLKLKVKILEMDEELVIPVERADKRYFPLGRGQAAGGDDRGVPQVAAYEPRGLISDIVMQDAAVQIYLRSVLQVMNALQVNVSVYCMNRCGNEVRLLGDVKPGDSLRLPLQAVYTPTAEIFFSVEDFTVSVSPFIWRELQQEVRLTKLLHCDSKDKNSGEKFYLKAVGTMEQVFYGHTNRSTFASSCYDVVLKPAVKMQNCLPVPIVVSQLGLKRTQTFEPGEMFHLSHLAPNRASIVVMIESYLNKCWVCTKNLPEEEVEFSVWSFESHDSPSVMTLDLGMHNVDLEGIQVLSLYCPFWMLNKTGFTLSYRSMDDTGNVIFHPKEYKDPILFSFKAKNFFGKKKASIRIEFGEWSDKFSLDVPGSSGVITCKLEGRTYQVAIENKLTFNSLTKMVIFAPFFLIINEAPFDIQYQEFNRSADPWQTVTKNSVCPLWPAIEKEEKLLLLRVANSTEICAPFLYTDQHSTCLKLNNSYGGLTVEVAVNEDGTYITAQQYKPGQAPALLVNYTNFNITVYEKENVNVKQLPPLHEMLYAWDNPAGPQKLIFEGYRKKEVEVEIRQDGIGDFMVGEHQRLYWVSFLNGMQRVVLVTGDIILAKGAHLVGDCDIVDTEMVLSMQGMGLSLVDDQRMQEIIYISMSNSGIIWECCKIGARRYKNIEDSKAIQLEEAYQHYLNLKMVSDEPVPVVVKVDEKTEVNFEEMRMLKPNQRILRRTLEPGLWASYGVTTHSVRIHARLHRLQVDQQLPLPTFPVVLAPVPPPRSVANDVGIKPFIEVSIVERIMEHTKVRQYKYYKVLIQEFHIKVDMGLLTALMGMFPQKMLTEQEALDAFTTDLETANQPLEALAASEAANDQKNFYDNLHLSPLKVHVSFSLGGATQLPTFVGTILQSIGVTLTDMNDVVFKLSYYERNYEFLSQKELMAQVQSHYMGQGLKQMYVLVLGLDVIGNPYGLVIGLKKGVEDLFYEPFQGAIQGPGEFAEGLFLGVRSLVGHTVGGAAGAVSRITGAMGHGLAALSLDKDFQRRRRDNMNKPPATLQEGLARSGKGLVMGVVDGVTGVFTKPFEGARDEGVKGFFEGLGRGAVGLVARPTAGVVDFAAGSLDAVKRAADLSEEITKRRAARYLPPETGVRPYSRLKAEGYKMLFELEKGKFLTTDTYQAHVWVIPNKDVLMCTDKRLLYLEKNQVFGGWQIQWSYLWTEIPEVPTQVNKGVYIPTAKRKVLGMFNTSGSGKVVFLYDEQQRKYFLAQCERLKQAAG